MERHRDAFLDMIRADVDLLFCNEHELMSLYQTDDLSVAMTLGAADVDVLACTVGERGAYVVQGENEVHAHAASMNVEDVTGAGDLFAAGFLYGLTSGRDYLTCGRMGCVAAGEIIGHIGARPEADLMDLFASEGLV